MKTVQWNPQNLAVDALRECGDMLEQQKIRHAARAAHDAVHCSLVEFWSNMGSGDGHPYKKKDKLVKHIKGLEEKKENNQALVFNKDESKEWFSVIGTRQLLKLTQKEQSFSSSVPNWKALGRLVDIRDSIEHPKPGETAWCVSVCLESIEAGANLAEWALRELNYDMTHLADRIRRASKAIPQP